MFHLFFLINHHLIVKFYKQIIMYNVLLVYYQLLRYELFYFLLTILNFLSLQNSLNKVFKAKFHQFKQKKILILKKKVFHLVRKY